VSVEEGINFAQFHWVDVYAFLKPYSENALVKTFLDFMKERLMLESKTYFDNVIA
jgi:hypothetical protein